METRLPEDPTSLNPRDIELETENYKLKIQTYYGDVELYYLDKEYPQSLPKKLNRARDKESKRLVSEAIEVYIDLIDNLTEQEIEGNLDQMDFQEKVKDGMFDTLEKLETMRKGWE